MPAVRMMAAPPAQHDDDPAARWHPAARADDDAAASGPNQARGPARCRRRVRRSSAPPKARRSPSCSRAAAPRRCRRRSPASGRTPAPASMPAPFRRRSSRRWPPIPARAGCRRGHARQGAGPGWSIETGERQLVPRSTREGGTDRRSKRSISTRRARSRSAGTLAVPRQNVASTLRRVALPGVMLALGAMAIGGYFALSSKHHLIVPPPAPAKIAAAAPAAIATPTPAAGRGGGTRRPPRLRPRPPRRRRRDRCRRSLHCTVAAAADSRAGACRACCARARARA